MQINNSKTLRMSPHVEARPYPINNCNDDLEYDDVTTPLYHVFVSQGKIKMLFLVAQIPSTRDYKVVKCEYITLHGIDERNIYLNTVDNISISADPTIVNEVFEWSLKPYRIKILNATFHNFEFFETEIEGKGFIFEDSSVYDELKAYIIKKCKQMLQNPYILEY